VVEAAIRYVGRSWWRTARVADPPEAQRSLDTWCLEVADQRRRGPLTVVQKAAAEPLLALPATAYPTELRLARVVSSSALVSFEGNRYSVPPALARQTVTVRVRVGEPLVQIVSAAGVLVASHLRLPAGAVSSSASRRTSGVGAGGAGRLHDQATLRAQAKPAAERRGARPRHRAEQRRRRRDPIARELRQLVAS
jgi:hypothetical protein